MAISLHGNTYCLDIHCFALCLMAVRRALLISWSVSLENIDALFANKVQTAIYRIFQEILTNIGKHADPTQVSILAKRKDNRAIFAIEDNGRGFDIEGGWQSSPKAGMGLLAKEERILMLEGDLQLWSRRNQGTTITFEIPWRHNTRAQNYSGSQKNFLYLSPLA